MWKLIRFSWVLLLFGCSGETTKYVSPQDERCSNLAREAEYIILDQKGEVHLKEASLEETLDLAKNPEISMVEPNYRTLHSDLITLDTLPSYERNDWNSIGVKSLWDRGILGQGVTVAVIDGGVDTTAPFLASQIWVNVSEIPGGGLDGIDNDNNALVDDFKGWNFFNQSREQNNETDHGTQIAQIIAGNESSPVGRGIAPLAKILPIDFMNEEGGDEYHALLSIEYAISQGARIINNSWLAPCSVILKTQYPKWQAQGVLLVHAAGNDAVNLDHSPEASSNFSGPSFLSVGSTDSHSMRAEFSNFGSNVILYAPGTELWATQQNSRFSAYSSVNIAGTSYSAAIVSGAAALILSDHPTWTSGMVRRYLLSVAQEGSGSRLPNLRLK